MNTSNPLTLKTLVLAISSSLFLPQAVLADQYHYKDILLGDRATGLAGAYTAIADDASGLYYNPAGVVYSSQPKISGSVNAYNYKDTTYKGITKANPNQKWTRKSSGMVANYFGMVQPIGDSSIGFSIALPNYELEDQSDSFTNLEASQRIIGNGATQGLRSNDGTALIDQANPSDAITKQVIDYNNQDSTTLVGASYATPLTKDLSFGITLYGYSRKKEQTFKQISTIELTSGDFAKSDFYQKVQSEEFGFQPRLGLMWSPADKLSIGLMAQTTFILSQSPKSRISENLCTATGCFEWKDNGTPNDSSDDYYGEMTSADIANQEIGLKNSTKNDLPVEINLGIAYFATDAMLYSADFSYATKTDVYEATINGAVAAEYFIDPTWAIRGGVYSNRANTSSNVAQSGNDHVDLYGGAFSVTRYTKGSNISLGINYATGSGQANLFPGSTNVQDITVNAASLFISTSASF